MYCSREKCALKNFNSIKFKRGDLRPLFQTARYIESCVWKAVSSHHPQEVLLDQFSLYVHKSGLKPDSFLFFAAIIVFNVRYIWKTVPDSYTITVKQMCCFREGYAKKINSIKFKMAILRPLVSLICVISKKNVPDSLTKFNVLIVFYI